MCGILILLGFLFARTEVFVNYEDKKSVDKGVEKDTSSSCLPLFHGETLSGGNLILKLNTMSRKEMDLTPLKLPNLDTVVTTQRGSSVLLGECCTRLSQDYSTTWRGTRYLNLIYLNPSSTDI